MATISWLGVRSLSVTLGMEKEMKRFSSLSLGAVRTLLALSLLGGAAITLSACNTTAGVGQDVSATGHAVTNTADKAKSAL